MGTLGATTPVDGIGSEACRTICVIHKLISEEEEGTMTTVIALALGMTLSLLSWDNTYPSLFWVRKAGAEHLGCTRPEDEGERKGR